MINFEETIAAISTAPGLGAIAVVRLSGSEAFEIASKIFSPNKKSSTEKIHWESHLARHGYIHHPESGELIDEVVVIPFKGPRTYTGEDLIEITCHGGPVVTTEILQLLLRMGARLALRGEFTQRAFLSGRIDLTQAEAVLDIIQAKTSRQGRRALSALTGELGTRIKIVRDDLLKLLTRIVAGIDFPEEIGDAPEPEIETVVKQSMKRLEEFLRTARTGRYLRDGLRLAIVGRPNAGKSSLLNQLLKFERAIVTEIPGTTRDSLEELLDLNGIPIVLVDTAGIRPTDDRVELIGIERSKQAIATADLILLIADLQAGWSAPEQEIEGIIADKPFLLIVNKIDLASAHDLSQFTANAPGYISTVCISAMTGQRIEELTRAIEAFVFQDAQSREGPSLNARQTELCAKAVQALSMVESAMGSGFPQDCLATDLKTAVDALSEISGELVTEEVITQVFATFCIGK